MRRLMLETAIRLMQSGRMPSVSDVAEAADVSRATAYRYFPNQAAMIQAAVDEALGPILDWRPAEGPGARDVEADVEALISFAFPRLEAYEATHRAALMLALDQWQRRRAGTLGSEARVVRGNRRGLLKAAVAPLADTIGVDSAERVAKALSLVFGVEAIVILKDIWGLEEPAAREVVTWAARALVRAAKAEAGEGATAALQSSSAS